MDNVISNATSSVSVIIPCFNCEDTLERCVESVAAQTCLPAEVLLVNDCSTDGTEKVIQKLAAKYSAGWIRPISFDFNRGAACARNEGWNRATQKFIAFLDSDDVWHPQKIEIQYKWMLDHPECTLSIHLFALRKKEAILEYEELQAAGLTALPLHRRRLFFSNSIATSSVMLKRDIAHRFPHSYRYGDDFSLWLDICFSGGLCFCLPLELGYRFKFPFGENGLSSQLWKMQKGELRAYFGLWKKRRVGWLATTIVVIYSFLKFFRRVLITRCRVRGS
jgi:glycosyltransferase involved in cell wall biosynthesis